MRIKGFFIELGAMLMRSLIPVILTVGILLCFSSAYSIRQDAGLVALGCIGIALIWELCFKPRRRGLLVLGVVLTLAVLGYLMLDWLRSGTYALLLDVDAALEIRLAPMIFEGVGIDADLMQGGINLLWFIISVPLCLFFSYCCSLIKAPILCYILALPLGVLAVIWVDLPPSNEALTVLILGLIMLPLQQLCCRSESRLIHLVSLGMASLCLGYIFLIKPIAAKIDLEWLKAEELYELFVYENPFASEEVLLKQPESKSLLDADATESNSRVMTISGDIEGTIYLRGYSLGFYSGTAFEKVIMDPPRGEELLLSANAVRSGYRDTTPSAVTVEYAAPSELLYLPYYSAVGGEAIFGEDAVRVSRKIDTYTITDYYPTHTVSVDRMQLPAALAELEADYRQRVYPAYTAPNGRLLDFAKNNIGIDESTDRHSAIASIAHYLRDNCHYSLKVAPTPPNEDAVWYFLNTSKEGNCVHYASASAAILQAMGIPARFVGGFMKDVSNNMTLGLDGLDQCNILASDAHAWIEVYFDGIGFLPFEVTFSNMGVDITSTPQDTSEPTAEPTIEPTAEPTIEPVEEPNQAPSPEPTAGTEGEPSPTGGSQIIAYATPDEPTDEVNLTALWIVLGLVGLASLIVGRKLLRDYHWKRRAQRQSNNRYAIAAYRRSQRLQSFTHQGSELLKALAQKARFSNHRLTNKEREAAEAELNNQLAIIGSLPRLKRIVIVWIIGV